MTFRKLFAAVLAWLAASIAGPAMAEESGCRFLEMRLMQLQSGARKASEAMAVHDMLVQRRCRPGARKVDRQAKRPEVRKTPVPAARPAAQAKPVTAARAKPVIGAARAKPVVGVRAARRTKPAAINRPRPERKAAQGPEPKAEADVLLANGTFRTLCVRSCDGYYFPISFSTTRDHFPSDQAICDQMCPAAGSRLYVHEVGDGGPENMVSVDGSAYSELPSAFKYRSAVDESCTCRPPGGDAERANAIDAPGARLTRNRIAPPPMPRPAFGEDPETLANRAGRLDFGAALAPALASLDGTGRSVRIVWPERPSSQAALMISAVPN